MIQNLDAPLPDRVPAPPVDRDPRVRFKHPVRVVPIGGPPRAYRVLSANLSRDGMFLKMPTPFDMGTKVALSLEAGGRVLPFAQGEVVWRDLAEPNLIELLALDEAGFNQRFVGTPMVRTKRRGLLRNVCVALGNVGDPAALPALARAVNDPEPLVAEHAAWAVAQIEQRTK